MHIITSACIEGGLLLGSIISDCNTIFTVYNVGHHRLTSYSLTTLGWSKVSIQDISRERSLLACSSNFVLSTILTATFSEHTQHKREYWTYVPFVTTCKQDFTLEYVYLICVPFVTMMLTC